MFSKCFRLLRPLAIPSLIVNDIVASDLLTKVSKLFWNSSSAVRIPARAPLPHPTLSTLSVTDECLTSYYEIPKGGSGQDVFQN